MSTCVAPVEIGLYTAFVTMVQRSPLGKSSGRERMLFNLHLAVERYRSQPAQSEEMR